MNEQPDKFDLCSHDAADDKIGELLRLFPESRTDGGKLDFDRRHQPGMPLAQCLTADANGLRRGRALGNDQPYRVLLKFQAKTETLVA